MFKKFITALAIIASLINSAHPEKAKKIIVRQIAVSMPPPPPPPEAKSLQKPQIPKIRVSRTGGGPAIEIGDLSLTLEVKNARKPPPVKQHDMMTLTNQLNFDWSDVFSLSELDETPRLLSRLAIHFPNELKRRGITKTQARVSVMIDIDGKVLLRNIDYSSHPELNDAIRKLVKQARFTAPKKNGVAVRASFIWPLEFDDKHKF